jgi:hypothetical protein
MLKLQLRTALNFHTELTQEKLQLSISKILMFLGLSLDTQKEEHILDKQMKLLLKNWNLL